MVNAYLFIYCAGVEAAPDRDHVGDYQWRCWIPVLIRGGRARGREGKKEVWMYVCTHACMHTYSCVHAHILYMFCSNETYWN